MYLDDDPTVMVGQGKALDPATAAELRDLASDETAVTLPTETVLRAAGLFLAERGRPGVLVEVEAYGGGTAVTRRWIGEADDEEWAALFTGYQVSAYRLEGQQVYCSPEEDEQLARFLAGRPVEMDLSWTTTKTRAQVTAGRTKVKVRIVVEPPTPYTRFELTQYPKMAEAGEDIRIVAVPQGGWPPELPHHDYWLFDDREVWKLYYHENFHFKGAELFDDPEVIAEHRRWRDLALARAVSLHGYLASRRADDQERPSA